MSQYADAKFVLSANAPEHFRREDVRKYLISNKERFAKIRKFSLTANEDRSWTIFNHMHTIQKDDPSASAKDCEKTLTVLLDLSLQGIRRLNLTIRLKDKRYKDQLKKYKDVFVNVLDNVKSGRQTNVFGEFSAITPHATDEWADATVRGCGFGTAGVINLDALMHAIREVDDHFTMARHR